MRRLAYAALFGVLVLSAPGCSMKSAVSKISVELRKVHITHIDKEGFQATVYMQLNNPNRFSMTVSDFRYQAFVSGEEIARGETETEFNLPAEGSALAELPLEVTYGSMRDKLPEILRGGLGYRVVGEVGFKTWLGRYAVPFDTEKKPKTGAGKRKKHKRDGDGKVPETGGER